MFGIGMQELVIILAVALIFIGPKKLPELAKQIAKGMRELRRASDDLKASIMVDIDEESPAERWRRERLQHQKSLPARDDDAEALIKNSKLAGTDVVSRADDPAVDGSTSDASTNDASTNDAGAGDASSRDTLSASDAMQASHPDAQLSQAEEEARDKARIEAALEDPAIKDAIEKAQAQKPDATTPDDDGTNGESVGRP